MANQVTVNVTINASGAQAGAAVFQSSVNSLFAPVNTLNTSVLGLNNSVSQLTQQMAQCAQGSRSAAGSFAAFTAANLASDAIRKFTESLKELIVDSTLYAARTQELGVALGAIAQASGINLEVLKQQEFAMKQLNITTQDARTTLSRFLQAELDIGKSGALSRVAQDLAIISGLSTSEELNKLIIGIQTLQSRNLRTAGVFITVDEVLDKLSKTTHRARDSFSTLEKQQATLNAVLEFGTRVTGAYEAAMTTASKQIRSMERLVAEAQNRFGEQFLPVLELVVEGMSKMFEWVAKHPRVFTLLATSVGILSLAFILLNTRVIATTLSMAAFVVQGIARMFTTLPGVTVNLAELATTLGIVSTQANTAAASFGFLQVALGGFATVLGLLSLVVGIGSLIYNLADATDEYVKVSDSAIIQGAAQVKAYENQNIAVQAYHASLIAMNNDPALKESAGLVTQYRGQESITKAASSDIKNAQSQVAALRAEIVGLEERASRAPSGIEGSGIRVGVADRLKVSNDSLSRQIDLLEKSKVRYADSKAFQDAMSSSLSKLNNTTIDGANRAVAAEETYQKFLKERSPIVQALIYSTGSYTSALDELISRENRLSATRATSLVTNLRLSEKERDDAQATIDATQRSLTELEAKRAGTFVLKGDNSEFAQKVSRAQIANAKMFSEAAETESNTLSKAIGKQGDTFTEASGKIDEYNRQLLTIKTSYGATTKEVYELFYSGKDAAVSFEEFSKRMDDATESQRRFKEMTEKAELGIVSFASALEKVTLPPIDIVTPEEKLGKKFELFQKEIDKFRERIQEKATEQGRGPIKLDYSDILGDPELLKKLTEQTASAQKDIGELINKFYARDVSGAIKQGLGEVALDSEDSVRKILEITQKLFTKMGDEAKKAKRNNKDESEKLQESLIRTKEQINSFLDTGNKDFKIRIELEDAERVKKDLETIMTLRHNMGIPLNIPIDKNSVQQTRKELEVLGNVFDELRKVQNDYLEARIRAGAPVQNAEIRTETMLLKLVRDRRNEEQQLSAEIATAISKRISLEKSSGDTQRLQARAFLEVLNEEQTQREGLVTAFTKFQIQEGKFSVADQNSIIQDALKVANDPTIVAINTTTKAIEDSTKIINDSMVDFSKAFGDSILKGNDALRFSFDSGTDVLRHHSSLQEQMVDKLTVIANNAGAGVSAGIDGGYAGAGSGKHTILNGPQIASILRGVGFPADKIRVMTAVALAESSGDVGALNPGNNGINEYSRGLFQINTKGNPKYSNMNLEDPTVNARVALELLQNKKGIHNWGAFDDGRYRGFLNKTGVPSDVASPFEYSQRKAVTAPEESIEGLAAAMKIIHQAATRIRSSRMLEALGISGTKDNIAEFSGPAGTRALKETFESLTTQKFDIELRQKKLELMRLTVARQNELHRQQLVITDQEDRYNQEQQVEIDNVLKLQNSSRDLDRLYTDRISILQAVQEAQQNSINSDIEAQKESIRLAEEARSREEDFAGHLTDVMKKENNARWKSDQDLDDNLAVLQANRDSKYYESESFRTRVTKEAARERGDTEQGLYQQLFKLQDDFIHRSDNNAIEYKISWQEAINSVANKDKEATKRILKDQVEIADQTTLSQERIRATVLDSIAQTQGISESIGGLFNDTFKVYSDAIDKWIDKTTARTGRLRAIFNGFFKSISRRAIGSVETFLLDALFPESKASKDAKTGIPISSNKTDSAFRNAATAVNMLAQSSRTAAENGVEVAASSVQVINSASTLASSLASVSYAADIATQSLMRTGAVSGGGVPTSGAGAARNIFSGLGFGGVFGGGGTSTVAGGAAARTATLTRLFAGQGTPYGTGSAGALSGIFKTINPFSSSGALAGHASSGSFSTVGLNAGLNSGLLTTNPNVNLDASLLRLKPLETLSGAITGIGARGSLPTLSGKGGLAGIFGQSGPLGGLGQLFSKAGVSKLAGSLALQAPMLGFGLGSSLGGQSGIGSILGGLGGGVLGLGLLGGLSASGILGGIGALGGTAAAGASAGLIGALGLGGLSTSIGGIGALGSLAPLLSFAIPAAIIAAPLIIGAIIFSKNKARQEAEKVRNQASINTINDVYDILFAAQRGDLTVAQAKAEWEKAHQVYLQSIASIKDSKTKRNALLWWDYISGTKIDPGGKTANIWTKVEAAARQGELAKAAEQKIVPTYAMGESAGPTYTNLIRVSSGETMFYPGMSSGVRIPGAFDGKDNILTLAPKGTIIKNPQQMIYPAGEYAGGGVHGVAPAAARTGAASASPPAITVINVMSEEEAIKLHNKIPDSYFAESIIRDSKVNPFGVPAAVMDALSAGR